MNRIGSYSEQHQHTVGLAYQVLIHGYVCQACIGNTGNVLGVVLQGGTARNALQRHCSYQPSI